jgi:hypothetical protein
MGQNFEIRIGRFLHIKDNILGGYVKEKIFAVMFW